MAIRVPFSAPRADDGEGSTEASVAFEELWEHRASLRQLCQRIVGDTATADDVVQETYLRALHNLDRLERRPSLMPWLATVARRRSIDELRRRRHQFPIELVPDEFTKPEVDPGESAAVNDTIRKVRQALTTLTDRERELLIRQVHHGMTLAELASEERTSVASVRSVLSRARTKLRNALTESGARALAPVFGAGAWVRRRLTDLGLRTQQALPVLSGGSERMAEVVAAGVAAAALAVTGLTPPSAPTSSGRVALAVEANAVEGGGGSTGVDVSSGAFPGAPVDAGPAGPGPGGASAAVSGTERGASPPFSAPTSGSLPSLAAPPTPSGPPPVGGSEPEPEQPDEAEIEHLAIPVGWGAGGTGTGPATPPLFALGRYSGNCPVGSCDVLFVSDDGGASWRKVKSVGLVGSRLFVAPGYPADPRIYAMGSQGLLVSTDGGRSFSRVLDSTYAGPAAMSPGFGLSTDSHDSIFIGRAPFWDYDAGDDEARPLALTGLAADTATLAFTPGYVSSPLLFAGSYAPSAHGALAPAVYACRAGVCDDRVVIGDLAGLPQVFVSSTFEQDGLVFAWHHNRLYRSSDRGASFARVSLPLDGVVRALTDDGAGTLYAAVAPQDGLRDGGLLRSSDGGRTWSAAGRGTPLERGVATVAALPGGRVVVGVAEAAGGGVYCSSDGGATWAPRCGG